ncbi:glucan biosynthesis protein D [Altericroceibacterium spongiae]|nr:glucan biosynthesis protein D [Altericroceibacterium spongiae]
MAQTGRLGPPEKFSWDRLKKRARDLARQAYAGQTKAEVMASDFDEYVKLSYGEAEAIEGSVRLFPAARTVAEHPVAMHILENGKARLIEDTSSLFIGGKDADAAGFRVMDSSGERDWLAYLGASYFRASGSRGQYGLSARAIAVNIGLSEAEEFPDFTDFWIERVGEEHFIIYALLNGPSVTGAYRFDSQMGQTGVTQDIRAALFFRKDIKRLGIAPETSMFWYDQSDDHRDSDWRPEIHDSDGLAIWSGTGERIWRPLANPDHPRVNTFQTQSPKGFGLLQRDQKFDHYQDDSVFYDRRPNLWVTPQGDWGAGEVMLYEMPTDRETTDNIGAFWTPKEPARAGGSMELAYSLHWTSEDPTKNVVARNVDFFIGPAGIPGKKVIAGASKYVFDFEGESLAGLDRESGVEIVTNLPEDAVLSSSAYPVVDQPNRWRAMLDIRDNLTEPLDCRLFLQRGSDALTETVITSLQA